MCPFETAHLYPLDKCLVVQLLVHRVVLLLIFKPYILVAVQTGAATLENSMEAPQKIKKRTTLRPSNCTTRYLSKGYSIHRRGTCTPMFIAALSTIAKVWKEPKCPSMDEWIKMWYIYICIYIYTYIMEYESAIKKNEILPFATTWMELEGIMLSEISQRKTKIILLHSYEDFKRQNR